LLQRTGFPYTRKPYGSDVQFAITQANGADAAAAWMLAEKLVQIQKLPLFDARWQIGLKNLQGKNTVVAGTAQQLPSDLTQGLPLRFGEVSVAPYPVEVSAAGPGELGPLDRLWLWLRTKFHAAEVSDLLPTTAWATQNGIGLGQQAALLQARMPGAADNTLTVLTAATEAALLRQTDALVQPAVWGQLRGDLVLWRDDTQLASQMVGPRYTVGQAALSSRIGFVLSVHPWFWGVIITVLALLLAAVTLRLLMRFRHRHHARHHPSSDDPPPLV
jgi:hypothetical protein